jgi:glyceraldehyde 3-phosphate dehydrogenase
MTPIRLGINGMGRIGRLALRHALARGTDASVARKGPPVEVVAANDLAESDELAYLLTHDSVHRYQLPKVQAEGHALQVNGSKIALFKEKDPSKIPWAAHGVDIVIEATGRFTTGEQMAGHRSASDGPSHVVLAAPGKGVDKTIVIGVNEDSLDPAKDRLISNASCTTNALTPVLMTLDRIFGVRWGLVGTTHAYTNGRRQHRADLDRRRQSDRPGAAEPQRQGRRHRRARARRRRLALRRRLHPRGQPEPRARARGAA